MVWNPVPAPVLTHRDGEEGTAGARGVRHSLTRAPGCSPVPPSEITNRLRTGNLRLGSETKGACAGWRRPVRAGAMVGMQTSPALAAVTVGTGPVSLAD